MRRSLVIAILMPKVLVCIGNRDTCDPSYYPEIRPSHQAARYQLSDQTAPLCGPCLATISERRKAIGFEVTMVRADDGGPEAQAVG